MSDKLTRKDLKQPDAFQKKGAELSGWLLERRKHAVIVVVLALLGFGGAALAGYLSSRGEEKTARALGAALAVLEKPVEGDLRPSAPGEQPFKTAKEKDEAIVKALTEYRGQHRGKPAATAAMPVAQALLRLGRHDEAIAAFDEYLLGAPADEPLRLAALEGKGYALESKGKLEEAIGAFEQLSRETKGEFMSGMGLYHRARMHILQSKKEQAAQELSEIPAVAPSSAAARLASDRMALLAAEGVKVPPPAKPSPDAG